MTEANITIEAVENGIQLAHIFGQLDESNVDEKIQELYKVVEQNPKGLKLLLDLENLDYMNSKSIGYLTDLYGKITESQGRVVIAKAKANIIDILQVVGLTQLINSYNSIEEAKTALSTETAGTPTPAPTAPVPVTPKPTPEPTPAPAPAPVTPAPAPAPVAPTPPPVTPAAPAPAPVAPTPTPAPTQEDGTYKLS